MHTDLAAASDSVAVLPPPPHLRPVWMLIAFCRHLAFLIATAQASVPRVRDVH